MNSGTSEPAATAPAAASVSSSSSMLQNVTTSHVVATGSTTALLAQVLVWISHWPWQPLSMDTGMAFAGLLVGAVGGMMGYLKNRKGN